MTNDYVELSKLLHPERLPTEELINILESRCIQIKNMGGMTRDQLLDLFHRVLTPLEQRTRHRTGVQSINTHNGHKNTEDTKEVCKMEYEAHAELTVKRGCSDQTSEGVSPMKKTRQKICWP